MSSSPADTATAGATERSIRYRGWRVVLACFIIAIFAWGLGFYGQGVYLSELSRSRGWSTSLMSSATTLYYLAGTGLVIFVSDILKRLGPRTILIIGATCWSLGLLALAVITRPWQLFGAYLLMSLGWMSTSLAALTTIVGLWFVERRGLAISLALTGASFGGILLTPLMVATIARWGFSDAMFAMAALTFVVIVGLAVFVIGSPESAQVAVAPPGAARSGATSEHVWTRARALRSLQFWTMTLPFALGIAAQVGFLVHQIAFLEPKLGVQRASLAVALTTAMAVLGRFVMGAVIDRLDQRMVSAASFLSQTVALLILISTGNDAALFAGSALFGFSVGNLITLPSLIITREFGIASFGMLIGLSVAINQVIYSFGPGVVGWLRDFSGTYTASFLLCMALQVLAAIIIMIPSQPRTPSLP
jgi:MFS family permease